MSRHTGMPGQHLLLLDRGIVLVSAVPSAGVGGPCLGAHAVTKELMVRLDRARAKLAGPYLTLMGGRMYEQTNIRTAPLEVLSRRLRSGTSL